MKLRKYMVVLLLLMLFPGAALMAADEDSYIERIEVEGNVRIKAETIIYYMESREGDLYNEKNISYDFQNLWKTGLFSDLKLYVKDGLEGKIIVVVVKEQYIIDMVDYKGLEQVSASDIVEAADRAGINLKRGDYLDMGKVSAMKQVIKEILGYKGYQVSEVKQEIVPGSSGKCDVIFQIGEGSTIRIEQIRFVGNQAFTDWEIRKEMENLGNYHLLSFISSADLYNEVKFAQDVQKIRDLYWSRGYLDVSISEPKLIPVKRFDLLSKDKVTRYYLDITISEGIQYKVGEISVEGNTEYESDLLLRALNMKKGQIYNHENVKGWAEFLKTIYGHKGYVMVSLLDERKKHKDTATVDLNVKITENDIYHVDQINITGNTSTIDEVIRRQMLIAEGDVFDNKLVEISVNRIRQLGYFDQNILFEPKLDSQDKEVDLDIKVQERGTTNFNFGIAYSELEGLYGNFAIETSNLFGTGNTFGISAQWGTLTEVFSLNYRDPWFLGRRVGLGASVFIRNYDFPGYVDKRVGGSVNLSYPISTFASGSIGYRYQVVDISFPEYDPSEQNDYYSYYYDQYYYYYSAMAEAYPWLYPEGETRIASLIKTFRLNTIDHPLFPRSGFKGSISLEYAASFLGGNIDFLKGTFEVVKFFNPFNFGVFGIRGQLGWIETLSDDQIPILERYFLGGDKSIRGLNIRSVGGQIDENGIPTGGTKMMLLNVEYQFIISNEMRLILFFDAGNAFAEEQDFSIGNLRTTAGVEARIFMPVFNVPIRLIYAYNLNPLWYENESDFQFSMGVMF